MHTTSIVGATGVLAILLVAGPASAALISDNQAADLIDSGGVCDVTGDDALASVVSVSSSGVSTRTTSRDVDLDEDNVLLAIALANNGFSDIDFEDVVDFDSTDRHRSSLDVETDVDRDDVFAALAFGLGGVSDRDALACASDIDQDVEVEVTRSHDVDLTDDNVLLAIALSRNLDSSIDFDDIFSGDSSSSVEVTFDRDVDIDRDDALFLLAFG